MKTHRSGFTLLELLVVIAIIGIIATIIIASLGGANSKAKDSKAISQLSSMRTQAELFRSTYGGYGITTTDCDPRSGTLFDPSIPESLQALVQGMPSGYDLYCYADFDNWKAAVTISDGSLWCAESELDELVTGDECWIR